ncbi:EthD domain-containing protein [Paenibacillus sp. Lou8.1]|uniref:EthD domain-containing protein n=1 Tax=Paenibacillus sp. Lou8.1 TaxID=2962041 RepID=UPI0020B6696C|nr:EthD domain-containing protein [Paenibacillus sp. Lou8.1]MCP3807824.1 EthD domain-containing protein [Paenibacillus sp. Lou8.1]
MIKQMAVITRRPGMTHEEYVNWVKHIHGHQITCSNPLTIKKYYQNYVYDGAYGQKSDAQDGYQCVYSKDSVTELYFDDEEDMMKTFTDPYCLSTVVPDGANFADLTKNLPFIVMEQEIEVPNPTEGGFKVFYFVKRADKLTRDEFMKKYLKAHNEIVSGNEQITKQLRRCINNIQIELSGDGNIFKANGMPTVDGIFVMYFDSVQAFRVYERAMASYAENDGMFINQSKSYFLYTDELIIYNVETLAVD